MPTHSALFKSHPAKELLSSVLSRRPANSTGHREQEGSATGAAPCEGLRAVPPLLAAAGLFGTMAPHQRAGPAAFSTFPQASGCPDTINNTVKPQGDQRAISKAISPCLEKCVFVPLPSWGDARSPRPLHWELLDCGMAVRSLGSSTLVPAVRHGRRRWSRQAGFRSLGLGRS